MILKKITIIKLHTVKHTIQKLETSNPIRKIKKRKRKLTSRHAKMAMLVIKKNPLACPKDP
jgi:Mn-dependent DtxR family transcriptional regulator